MNKSKLKYFKGSSSTAVKNENLFSEYRKVKSVTFFNRINKLGFALSVEVFKKIQLNYAK